MRDEDEEYGYRMEAAYEANHRLDPASCDCGGEWRQVGYDRSFQGAEFVEFECTGCGRQESVVGEPSGYRR
jgi:hypothetical protein